MHLKGKHTYNTTAQQIWDILMDTEKLARITPGVSRLEETGKDQYNAVSEIKIGPVKGAFKGDLFLEEKKEPSSFILKVKQLSKIGNADATVQIHINELEGNQCELAFDGKAKLSGTLARTGQRVLTGVANTLTKQFFKALDEEVNNSIEITSPSIDSSETEIKTPIEETTSAKNMMESPSNVVESIVEETKTQETIPSAKIEAVPIKKVEGIENTNANGGLLSWLKSLFGLK